MNGKILSIIIIALIIVGAGILLYSSSQKVTTSNEQKNQTQQQNPPTQGNALSDQQLLEYAQSDFNQSEMMFKDIILGTYNNFPIRVTFPCSDVCPQATIRIIRYDVNISECSNPDGVIKAIRVPVGIGVMAQDFCFPKVIVDNNLYNFVNKTS